MDIWNIPASQITGCSVYFLSCILDADDHYAGHLFFILSEEKCIEYRSLSFREKIITGRILPAVYFL